MKLILQNLRLEELQQFQPQGKYSHVFKGVFDQLSIEFSAFYISDKTIKCHTTTHHKQH